MDYNHQLPPGTVSSLYPPPGFGCLCPPPGFRYRQIPLPFPCNEFQPPVHPTPSSKPEVPVSSPRTISSALSPSPFGSSSTCSSPASSVSSFIRPKVKTHPGPIARPVPINRQAPISRPVNSTQPGNLPRGLPKATVQPPINLATPPINAMINQPYHIIQPIYMWHCCCLAYSSPAAGFCGIDPTCKGPVVQQREMYDEIPEVSILSLSDDSSVERPKRPSIIQNTRKIPKRKRRRDHRNLRNRPHQEQQFPTGYLRAELPRRAFFAPIKSRQSSEMKKSAWIKRNKTRNNNSSVPMPIIRPIPVRPLLHIPNPVMPKSSGTSHAFQRTDDKHERHNDKVI